MFKLQSTRHFAVCRRQPLVSWPSEIVTALEQTANKSGALNGAYANAAAAATAVVVDTEAAADADAVAVAVGQMPPPAIKAG